MNVKKSENMKFNGRKINMTFVQWHFEPISVSNMIKRMLYVLTKTYTHWLIFPHSSFNLLIHSL